MQLETFTLDELEANINELKEMYKLFSEKTDIVWPKRWVEQHKNNVDYVKRKELKGVYDLNIFRYENAKKVWFDSNGNIKPKYKSIMINFYGGILWLHQLMQSLYNNSSQE